MIVRIVFCLFLFLNIGVLEAGDWSGLWRITRLYEGKTEATHHIFIPAKPDASVIVHNSDARPMDLEYFQPGEDQFELQFTQAARSHIAMNLKLRRTDAGVEGEWLFGHSQYRLTDAARGHRVMEADRWKPFEGLGKHRESGIIDINSLLLGEAPRKDFERFVRYWDNQIEPVYYFLFQEWLYGDAEDPVAHRRTQLRQLFDSLQREEVRTLIKRFPDLAAKAVSRMRAHGEKRVYNLYLVNAFSPKRTFSLTDLWTRPMTPYDKNCDCKLDLYEQFAVANPASYAGQGEHAELRMTMDLVKAAFWHAPPRSPLLELYRNGLALIIAAESLGVKLPADPPLELDPLKQAVKAQLAQPEPDISGLFPEDRTVFESPGYLLGIDLVRHLHAGKTEAQTVFLPDLEVMAGIARYLESQVPDNPKP